MRLLQATPPPLKPWLLKTDGFCTREEGRETRANSQALHRSSGSPLGSLSMLREKCKNRREHRYWPSATGGTVNLIAHRLLPSESSGTQLRQWICSCSGPISGEQPVSGNDTPNLYEHQGSPEIQTKAKDTQVAKQQCQENLLRWSHYRLQAQLHHGWHNHPGKDIQVLLMPVRVTSLLHNLQEHLAAAQTTGNLRDTELGGSLPPDITCLRHNAGPLGNTNKPHLCYPPSLTISRVTIPEHFWGTWKDFRFSSGIYLFFRLFWLSCVGNFKNKIPEK